MAATLVWNQAAVEALLRSPAGPIARDLDRRAARVESQAKVNASGRPGPNVVTGRLRSSITRSGPMVDGQGLYEDIGSGVFYGIFLELGTRNMPAYPYLVRALEAARG